jgi:hypothetical protein
MKYTQKKSEKNILLREENKPMYRYNEVSEGEGRVVEKGDTMKEVIVAAVVAHDF